VVIKASLVACLGGDRFGAHALYVFYNIEIYLDIYNVCVQLLLSGLQVISPIRAHTVVRVEPDPIDMATGTRVEEGRLNTSPYVFVCGRERCGACCDHHVAARLCGVL
jgi:hypothetical protein